MGLKAGRGFKYIYGPVSSWRLGSSLGIDLLSGKNKICTFDCLYCQLGKTKKFYEHKDVFVPVDKVIKELNSLPDLKADYITFSGSGEPTLAGNLGEAIKAIRKNRNEKIAVITNASLLDKEAVKKDLLSADLVLIKLDAASRESFEKINRPAPMINFDTMLKAIREFSRRFKGKLAMQVMFIGQNKSCVKELARLAKKICPDEIQLNTPLRPSGARPLSKEELREINKYFISECGDKIRVVSVYESGKRTLKPIDKQGIFRRRGSYS